MAANSNYDPFSFFQTGEFNLSTAPVDYRDLVDSAYRLCLFGYPAAVSKRPTLDNIPSTGRWSHFVSQQGPGVLWLSPGCDTKSTYGSVQPHADARVLFDGLLATGFQRFSKSVRHPSAMPDDAYRFDRRLLDWPAQHSSSDTLFYRALSGGDRSECLYPIKVSIPGLCAPMF
jgi:hypothetical protein